MPPPPRNPGRALRVTLACYLHARCFSYEALLQILKHIASNCNYRDVSKRMALLYAIRQGLALLFDRLTHVHDPVFKFSGDPTVFRCGDFGVAQQGDGAADLFLEQVRNTPQAQHAPCVTRPKRNTPKRNTSQA